MLKDIGYFALLVGVLIFVHELGHFLVAKAFKVKVLRFAIGFGPRIVGFTRGETEYRIGLLPLGGYVKMAGDSPYDELDPKDSERGFMAQAPWKRALIVLAGPAMNLVFPVLVYFLVFVGAREQVAARVGSIEPGMPAAVADLRPGDRIVAVNGVPMRSFEDVQETIKPRYDQPVSLLVERDGKTHQTDLTPVKRTVSNPIETVSFGQIGVSPVPKPPVVGVAPGSSAEKAGLRSFDRVLSINGKTVKDEGELFSALGRAEGTLEVQVLRREPLAVPGASLFVPSVVTLQVPKQPGDEYAALGADSGDLYVSFVAPGSPADRAGVARGDKLLAIDGADLASEFTFHYAGADGALRLRWLSPRGIEEREIALESTVFRDEFGNKGELPDHGIGLGGASAAEKTSVERVTVKIGIAEAFERSVQVVPNVIRQTAMIIGGLFTQKVPLESLGGPIMIFKLAKQTAERGADSYLELMALLSVNLGLMNLLPIPVLDGFHLLAAGWEGIRRRPIPVRAREVANLVGLALLVLLMIKVMINDLSR